MPIYWQWLGGFLVGFSLPDVWLVFASAFVGQNTPSSGVLAGFLNSKFVDFSVQSNT